MATKKRRALTRATTKEPTVDEALKRVKNATAPRRLSTRGVEEVCAAASALAAEVEGLRSRLEAQATTIDHLRVELKALQEDNAKLRRDQFESLGDWQRTLQHQVFTEMLKLMAAPQTDVQIMNAGPNYWLAMVKAARAIAELAYPTVEPEQ